MDKTIKRAKEVILIECESLKAQIKHLDKSFICAVDMIAGCSGRVVVMGVGKSGLIGRKISASMSSMGIPSAFSHPAECLHGDLGMVMANDVVIFLSYTGETDEIKKLLPVVKKMGVKVIAFTGRVHAKAWKGADCVINTAIKREACSYNLVPTSSTTAMLAMGDALALCAADRKGFSKERLAQFHPGGGIGKKLTAKVSDIMRSGKKKAVTDENMTVNDALLVMTETRLGATIVVDKNGRLKGYFTDGDLRRKLQKDKTLLTKKLKNVMTKNPVTIKPDLLAVEAAKILKQSNFDNIPVVDNKGKAVGILDEQDLLSEGIV